MNWMRCRNRSCKTLFVLKRYKFVKFITAFLASAAWSNSNGLRHPFNGIAKSAHGHPFSHFVTKRAIKLLRSGICQTPIIIGRSYFAAGLAGAVRVLAFRATNAAGKLWQGYGHMASSIPIGKNTIGNSSGGLQSTTIYRGNSVPISRKTYPNSKGSELK